MYYLLQPVTVHDVAYFIVMSLEPSLRRQAESDLLDQYCAELGRYGVEDYGLEQCLRSYKIVLYGFILRRVVFAVARNDVSGEQAQTLFSALIERTSEAIADHPIEELIE